MNPDIMAAYNVVLTNFEVVRKDWLAFDKVYSARTAAMKDELTRAYRVAEVIR